MAKEDFCCVDNFSVLIPYKDLEKLLKSASALEQVQQRLHRTEQQVDSLRCMYTEALMKIQEIERFM